MINNKDEDHFEDDLQHNQSGLKKKLTLVQVQEFSTYQKYLKVFYNKNRHLPAYSSRAIAKKLSWPRSYLHDLINGRKQLTVARAIQLARFLNLNSLDTEYLIALVFKEHKDNEVKAFYLDKISQEFDFKLRTVLVKERELMQNIQLLAVFEYIKLNNEIPTYKAFNKKFKTIKITDQKQIRTIISKLVDCQIIELDDRGFLKKVNVTTLLLDEIQLGIDIHRSFAENLIRFTYEPQRPVSLNSGFIKIPADKFEFFRSKLLAIRNSLESHSLSNRTDEQEIYQYSL
ncbi:MAG: TIGR02147 family protein, partial [Bdellovibrionales bacterium]|nr:TIGR02147 family protein [Bdellovibrionales bacterium]